MHPRDALFGVGESMPALPVCDHYCGVEARMRKSLALQAELGPVFDVTLDCEDGAPVGGEAEHVRMVVELALSAANRFGRVGVRVHPVDHPSFADDVSVLVSNAGDRLAYLMLPKVERLADVEQACAEVDRQALLNAPGKCLRHSRPEGSSKVAKPHLLESSLDRSVPIHVLIESPAALREVDAIARHPRIESLSFGLMDFVSAHRGAIPASGMSAQGQFSHPLVVRAKLEIAAACHAAGKTPSHGVVTEFNDLVATSAAATRASRELGYTRMWSIHPDQIAPIVAAFAPSAAELDQAIEIVIAAQEAQWAPIRHRHLGRDTLHDRASYRYFWHVLERAVRTGQTLPADVRNRFFAPTGVA